MESLQNLEREIEAIKARNMRVEADKAWETSWARRIFIAVSTYALLVILLVVIKVEQPFITALIPTTAYIISTLTLGFVKRWWLGSVGES